MTRRSRPVLSKAQLLDRLPRALRPKLDARQIRAVGLVHIVNLDAIMSGHGTYGLLVDWVESVFMWLRVAELLGAGIPEMHEQLTLTLSMMQRYGRTGHVSFNADEYQTAKDAVSVMDQLAAIVDQATAEEAVIWSTAKLAELIGPSSLTTQERLAA